jgi:outer membrane protein TolC
LESKIEQLTPVYGMKIFGGYAKANGTFPVYDGKLLTGSDGEAFFGIELPLLKGGATDEGRTKIEVTTKKVDQANADRSQELTDFVLNAKTAFWDWVYSKAKLEVSKSLLTFAEQRDRGLERRAQTGDIASIDRKDNLRIIYNRQARITNAELEWMDKTRKLSVYYRSESGEPLVLNESDVPGLSAPPKLGTQNLKDLLKTAVEENPEIQSLKLKINQLEREQLLAKNSTLPTLNMKIERVRELGSPNPNSKIQNELKAGLTLEWPLMMRKGRGELIKVDHEIDALKAKLQFLEDKLGARVSMIHQKIQLLLKNFETISNETNMAKEVAMGEQRRFTTGQTNIITVNLREEAAAEAQLKLTENLTLIYQARAELDALTHPIH